MSDTVLYVLNTRDERSRVKYLYTVYDYICIPILCVMCVRVDVCVCAVRGVYVCVSPCVLDLGRRPRGGGVGGKGAERGPFLQEGQGRGGRRALAKSLQGSCKVTHRAAQRVVGFERHRGAARAATGRPGRRQRACVGRGVSD